MSSPATAREATCGRQPIASWSARSNGAGKWAAISATRRAKWTAANEGVPAHRSAARIRPPSSRLPSRARCAPEPHLAGRPQSGQAGQRRACYRACVHHRAGPPADQKARGPERMTAAVRHRLSQSPPAIDAGVSWHGRFRFAGRFSRRSGLSAAASHPSRRPLRLPRGTATSIRAALRSSGLDDQTYADRRQPRGRNPRRGAGR
jgi:hypothetical protein